MDVITSPSPPRCEAASELRLTPKRLFLYSGNRCMYELDVYLFYVIGWFLILGLSELLALGRLSWGRCCWRWVRVICSSIGLSPVLMMNRNVLSSIRYKVFSLTSNKSGTLGRVFWVTLPVSENLCKIAGGDSGLRCGHVT